MQCDICGEEVENSDELAKHKEKLHAMSEGEQGGDEREMETPEVPEPESEPIIVPPPQGR
ncbi:MAG TPA: hypothetical protein VGK42_02470 [Candidatus Dormibacteraeota bacterium]